MKSIRSAGIYWLLGLALLHGIGQGQTSPALTMVQTIPLPGYTGSFDHFAFDSTLHRVLLAAEDHASVEVFDLRTGTHLRTVAGFEKPHSILVRPGARTILVTDSGASKSQLLDAATYQKIHNVELALGANCLLYDARKNRVYITAGGDRVHLPSSTLLAVNPDTGAVLKSVSLRSVHLQPMALDAATNRLFVNMADKNSVAVIDGDSLRMVTEWKIDVAKGNSPIAFDSAHHRLFVVCGDPGTLAVLDSDTGRITNTISVPADADDMDFDKSKHRLFIPGGDGFLGVYDVSDPDHVKQVGRVATRKGARTGMLVPREHRYVLAAPAVADDAAQIMVFDAH
jgi:DNA-binding beta-propeller fold protein YncE